MVRLLDGQLIASAWPRKRGKPKDVYQRDILDRMRSLQATVKRLNELEVRPLREALEQWNRENRGQMGSATIRLRDLLTSNLSGRFVAFLLSDGNWLVHADAINDLSRSLDWLEPQVGSMLTRTEQGWRPTIACAPGYKLRILPSSDVPDSCDPATYQPNVV